MWKTIPEDRHACVDDSILFEWTLNENFGTIKTSTITKTDATGIEHVLFRFNSTNKIKYQYDDKQITVLSHTEISVNSITVNGTGTYRIFITSNDDILQDECLLLVVPKEGMSNQIYTS